MVEDRERVERRAEQQDLTARLDEPRERARRAVAVVRRVIPASARARGPTAATLALGVEASLRARRGPDPLRDSAVVAVHLAGRGVEYRRLRGVGRAVRRRPV